MNASQELRPLPSRIASAVMVCSPLLLLSPVCLLYGIYRAVVAPNLFATDIDNTIFNFFALAIYVLMVCVTSTLLARKRIVPDTVMLLLLNGLLFVSPFILIAHGVFLEGHLAVALGILGIAMAKGQLEIFKRRLPESFVTAQLSIGAALVLAANFAAPLIFRRGLENDNDAWGLTSAYAWHLVFPLLVAWLNFIPSRQTSAAIWARPWFAPILYLLWLVGTSIQLWTVAYVDDRQLHVHQFTVAAWVLAWTAFRRARIFEPAWAPRIRFAAPILAILIPGTGALFGLDLRIAALLYMLNLPILAAAHRTLPALAMAGVSVLAAVCCMPAPWIAELSPALTRASFIALIIAAVTVGAIGMIRDARAGLLAAIGVGILAAVCGVSKTLALNAFVLFLFVHQLRWKTIGVNEHSLLAMAGVIWIAQTLSLELRNSMDARAASFVATLIVTLCLRNASLGLPTSLVPAFASIVILLLHPMYWSTKAVATAPSGVLAIAIGFALLAAGAWDSARRSLTARAHMKQAHADTDEYNPGDLPM